MRKSIYYFIYIALLVLLLYLGSQFFEYLRVLAGRTFHPGPMMVFSSIFAIFIGCYLALPNFISNVRKQGNWKLDWSMLIVFGVVSLFLALAPILYYLSPVGQTMPHLVLWLIMPNQGSTIGGVIFGYLVFSIPQKVN